MANVIDIDLGAEKPLKEIFDDLKDISKISGELLNIVYDSKNWRGEARDNLIKSLKYYNEKSDELKKKIDEILERVNDYIKKIKAANNDFGNKVPKT